MDLYIFCLMAFPGQDMVAGRIGQIGSSEPVSNRISEVDSEDEMTLSPAPSWQIMNEHISMIMDNNLRRAVYPTSSHRGERIYCAG